MPTTVSLLECSFHMLCSEMSYMDALWRPSCAASCNVAITHTHISIFFSAEEKLKASVSNEGRINVLLWYCLVGAYAGLPLGVEGSPGGKWLRVVQG